MATSTIASAIEVTADHVLQTIQEIEKDLLQADNQSNHKIYQAAKKVIELNNIFQQHTNEYNAAAKNFSKQMQAKLKNKSKIDKRKYIDDIDNWDSGLKKARETALSFLTQDFLKMAEKDLINLSKSIHELQALVNNYAQVNIGMVYVVNSGGEKVVFNLDGVDLADIVTIDRASLIRGGELKLRYDDSAIKNMISNMQEIEKKDKLFTSKIAPLLDNFFNEVTRRWDIAKAHKNNYILWRYTQQWHKAHISAFGDAEEAYLDVYMNYRTTTTLPHFLKVSGYDGQIHFFIYDYVSKVDNTAAGFFEDIQIGTTGQFYGSKSKGASLASVTPYVNLANLIVTAVDTNGGKFAVGTQKKNGPATVSGVAKVFSPRDSKKARTEITRIMKSDPNIVELESMIAAIGKGLKTK